MQKYTHATNASRVPFLHDLERMMTGPVFNHPSVVQWETFNEHDCVGVFNASDVVQLARSLDPHRLIDTDSGGPANSLYVRTGRAACFDVVPLLLTRCCATSALVCLAVSLSLCLSVSLSARGPDWRRQ